MGETGNEKNTVAADGQVYDLVRIVDKGSDINVLFVGNSITRHAPKREIGWLHDWGMAASCEENDYVHVTVRLIEEKLGPVNFATACCGEWERHYWEDESRLADWQSARDFCADILIIRIGENIYGLRERLAEEPLYAHYDRMVKFFRSNEGAQVIVTDNFWEDFGINADIGRVAQENGYAFVRIGDLGARDVDDYKAVKEYEHGGVAIHPNDEGMRRIAERIAAAVKKGKE